jgi:DNA-binding MarR family transcriptional regulator
LRFRADGEGQTVTDARELGDPGTSAFQVDKYPFYLLNRLVSRYNVIIEARLKTIGIDIPYWRVLMILGQKAPRSVGQIAETAVIPFSTMTRIVQRMSGAGLIACTPLETDNRVIEVALTSAGEIKLAEARTLTAPVYAQVIKGFSIEEFENVTANLGRLYENLADLLPAKGSGNRLRP